MAVQTEATTIWDLIKGGEADPVHRWLRWHPSEIDQCVQERSYHLPRALDEEELEEMRVAHRRWGADAETMAGLEKLGSPSTRVVITGQQPGLLAGPLYTIYKALGAVALARSLAERHRDLNFVPVFWCASEDHDFDEIRRVYWPGSGGELEEVLYSHPDWVGGRMIGTLKCRGRKNKRT